MGSTNTVLVTGATGFVGSHLVRALLARGNRVCALGRDFGPVADLVAAGAEPLRADLRDREAVVAACAGGVDAVYHVGALSAPWGKRADFEAVNVGGTEAVVEGCRRHGVRRLVYVSSPSVLFDGRDHEDLTDDAPYPRRFASVYSRTKKEGEDRVNAARDALECVILRPKAVFGPGDRALLPRVISAARRRRLPQIGDGRNRVDLTCIDNVVDALLLAADAPAAVGRTYTITNGEPVLLWDVIRDLLRRLGVPADLPAVPLPAALAAAAVMEATAAVTGREPTLTRYSALILARTQTHDISAARRDLGYHPRVSVAEGLERAIAAFPDAERPRAAAARC
ncbi:MAG TPA: NAD-dependent epimerase/dehydratase family protein [Armatimonadaceae bacterium]|nr:NAD-dependent epimerase/dehydratase family protein [Armatimonadaceae bacterium]